jgi:hypothetical protein
MTVGQALSGKEKIEQAIDRDPATHNAETERLVMTHGIFRFAIMPTPLKVMRWRKYRGCMKRIARLFCRRRLFPAE